MTHSKKTGAEVCFVAAVVQVYEAEWFPAFLKQQNQSVEIVGEFLMLSESEERKRDSCLRSAGVPDWNNKKQPIKYYAEVLSQPGYALISFTLLN